MSSNPVFLVCCIDFRYDSLVSKYLDAKELQYFESTAAGAALPLGYQSCSNVCNKKCKCNPSNNDMSLLRESICKNLEIALTLKPIKKVYLGNRN